MFLTVCGLMLLAAFWANRMDGRMLALTSLVGAIFFLPPPDLYDQFYIFCISAECLVAVISAALRAQASFAVITVCVLLALAHAFGYAMDGSTPFSPYHLIIKILEFVQITACVALSPIVAPILRNRHAKIN